MHKFITIITKTLLISTIPCFSQNTLQGGGAVGNGGDTITAFLESSRSALLSTLDLLNKNPYDFCHTHPDGRLQSEAARTECSQLVQSAIKQIPYLNKGNHPTKFMIRSTQLEVDGPDGRPRPVAARTALGPHGAIEFHLHSIEFLNPDLLLQLLTHEFLHKIELNGKYTEDNKATQAFSEGRLLLDLVAEFIATKAKDFRFIGPGFTLLDHFECRVDFLNGGPSLGMRGSSARRFDEKQNWKRFEVGIGKHPRDMEIYLLEDFTSKLELRMFAREEQGCFSTPTPLKASSRWTELQLWRVPNGRWEHSPAPELLQEIRLEEFHPVCEPRRTFGINWKNIAFSCYFAGSSGLSESAF